MNQEKQARFERGFARVVAAKLGPEMIKQSAGWMKGLGGLAAKGRGAINQGLTGLGRRVGGMAPGSEMQGLLTGSGGSNSLNLFKQFSGMPGGAAGADRHALSLGQNAAKRIGIGAGALAAPAALTQGVNSYGDHQRRQTIANMPMSQRLQAAFQLLSNPQMLAERL